MKILALTRYGRVGPSSRIRFFQYFPSLRESGIEVEVSPFLGDEYVHGLNRGTRSPQEILTAYFRRINRLLKRGAFDLIWMEKEALPWLPESIERAVLPSGIPYVLDYDDAVFHNYDMHSSRWVRGMLGGKHDQIMRNAVMVTAGNEYIAERARLAGAKRVELVPSVVDVSRYAVNVGQYHDSVTPVTVGWMGQRFNARYLRILEDPIRRLSNLGIARFVAVGSGDALRDLPIESVPWTEDSEAQCIAKFDIGLMPVPDEPFERGKCGYKLIQYMASGKPVIASPVGVNRSIVDHGSNGYLAQSSEDWESAITTLAQSPELRATYGEYGLEKARKHYSLAVWAPRVAKLLRQARQN